VLILIAEGGSWQELARDRQERGRGSVQENAIVSDNKQTRPPQMEERDKETSLKVMPTPHIRR